MARSSLLELPRPKSFLYIMSLRTGAEMITLSILINKVSGVYGLLAILTGVHLSALQLSMYIYSVAALILTTYLYPHIRSRSPLQCLTLAFFYAIDSIVNAAYTAAFGVAWFLVLAAHPDDVSKVPGTSTMNETAGFTSPENPVQEVDVIPSPAHPLTGEKAAMIGVGTADDSPAGLGNAVFQSGSIMSISAISALWAVRIYFILVMLAFARQVLRNHIATTSSTQSWQNDPTPGGEAKPAATILAENPFADTREEGKGWRGKLGRTMLRVAPRFWLGADDEETQWAHQLGGRFSRRNRGGNSTGEGQGQGTGERERRRRSGTGPPAPPKDLPGFVQTVPSEGR